MSNKFKFYLINTITVGVLGTINLGICTMFFNFKELSYLDITMIYSTLLLISMLAEYPSGILADKFGRKKVYSVGVILIGIQYLMYSQINNLTALLFAAAIAGLGGALVSGSLQAWIIVEEKKDGNIESLRGNFAKSKSFSSAITIIATLLLVFLNGNFVLIYRMCSVLMFLLAAYTLYVFEDNYGENKRVMDYNRETMHQLLHNRQMGIATVLFSIAIMFYSIFILYWPACAIEVKIPTKYTTVVYCVYLFGGVIMNLIISKPSLKIDKIDYLISCIGMIIIAFAMMRISGITSVILGMFVFGLGYCSLNPMLFGWLVEYLNDDNCASMISLIVALGSIVSVFVNLLIGKLMDGDNLELIRNMTISSGVICIIFLAYIKLKTHLNNKVQIEEE